MSVLYSGTGAKCCVSDEQLTTDGYIRMVVITIMEKRITYPMGASSRIQCDRSSKPEYQVECQT